MRKKEDSLLVQLPNPLWSFIQSTCQCSTDCCELDAFDLRNTLRWCKQQDKATIKLAVEQIDALTKTITSAKSVDVPGCGFRGPAKELADFLLKAKSELIPYATGG